MVNILNKSALILLILVIGLVHTVGATEPPIVASFSATPTSGTAPLTVQFTDTSTGNPSEWQWDFGDFQYSNKQNPSHTYSPGTYLVHLTDAGVDGMWRYHSNQTTTIVVTAPPAPIASFTANPISGPAPLTVQFTDTSSGNPTRWEWDFDDGYSSNLQNPSHIFSYACYNYQNSVHTVRLFSYDIYGNRTSATKNIQILGLPTNPVPAFTATPISGPAPLTVQFTDTSSDNPNDWAWFFGDGTTFDSQSDLQNPTHTYTISGVYNVRMVAGVKIKTSAYSISAYCHLYEPQSITSTITVLSPLAPGTTTSPLPASTQTTTISPTTTTAIPTTIGTTIQTTEPTTSTTTPPITSIYTPTSSRTPISKGTLKTFTPYPTDTPTQPSPLGVEIGIAAMMIFAVLVVKRK